MPLTKRRKGVGCGNRNKITHECDEFVVGCCEFRTYSYFLTLFYDFSRQSRYADVKERFTRQIKTSPILDNIPYYRAIFNFQFTIYKYGDN